MARAAVNGENWHVLGAGRACARARSLQCFDSMHSNSLSTAFVAQSVARLIFKPAAVLSVAIETLRFDQIAGNGTRSGDQQGESPAFHGHGRGLIRRSEKMTQSTPPPATAASGKCQRKALNEPHPSVVVVCLSSSQIPRARAGARARCTSDEGAHLFCL